MDAVASSVTEDDALLLRLMRDASRSIDKYTRRRFYPRQETRFFTLENSKQVRVDDDLLEVVTFRTQNGACTVASGVMWLAAGENWNRLPADRIVIDDSSGSVLNYSGTPQRSQEVTGIWGYRESWGDRAWVDTGISLAAAYVASAGSLALAGAGSVGPGASDTEGVHPRIAPGDLLKIGDEYLYVTGGAASGNGTVFVKPFMNGTTAAAHGSAASIARFVPEEDIEYCTRRLTVWAYGGLATPYTERVANVESGEITIPSAWPVDVKARLSRFVRREVKFFSGVV